MRCFLAAPLGEPALGVAQRTMRDLQERLPDVRWTRPETLHITVHFFGWVDDERVARALDAARPVTQRTEPFEVTIDRLGAFPDRGTPRVLWLGSSSESEPMTALASAVSHELATAGFAVEDRPFRAHCTLGRTRPPWPPEERDAWRSANATGIEPASFTASRLVLFESVTGRGGAVYTERASLPFAST